MIAIALLCAILLFVPGRLLEPFGLNVIVSHYRPWISLIFFGAACLLSTYPTYWVKEKIKLIKFKRRAIKRLQNLSPDEEGIIRQFLHNRTSTVMFHPKEGAVNNLVGDGILYRAADVGDLIVGFAHSLTPWVKDYLAKRGGGFSPAAREAVKIGLWRKRHSGALPFVRFSEALEQTGVCWNSDAVASANSTPGPEATKRAFEGLDALNEMAKAALPEARESIATHHKFNYTCRSGVRNSLRAHSSVGQSSGLIILHRQSGSRTVNNLQWHQSA